MITQIIAIAGLLLVVIAIRIHTWLDFRKNPLGKRCRVRLAGKWCKATVQNCYPLIVKLDSGPYYTADLNELKPILFEL